MTKLRLITLLTAVSIMMAVMAPAALASDQSTKEAAGWGCADAVGLPAGHCISPGTAKNFAKIVEKGLTFQLQVFDEDGNFLTAEIATFKDADSRPCPNDDDPRNTDGTYWEFVPGLWVCHHQPG